MGARLKLLAVLLGVPVVGFSIALAIQLSNDSDLRAAARRQRPDIAPERIASLTVTQVCHSNPDPRLASICASNARLSFIQGAAVTAVAIGLGLLGAITLAGSVARSDRTMLLVLFRPGLYITGFVVAGLILIHATIAVFLLLQVNAGISFAVAIGALAGVVALGRNTFSLVKKAETMAIGRAVSREEAPALWSTIDSLANQLSSLRPDHIVIGLDPTFFVTEANVVSLNGKLEGRTLYCSLPLARILSTDEFRAVIGQEEPPARPILRRAEAVANRIHQKPFAGIAETHTTHPTDSHPPLSARLQALKLTIDELTEAASDIGPADAAIGLVSNHEEHERQISQAYQLLLAQHVGIDLNAAAGDSQAASPLEG